MAGDAPAVKVYETEHALAFLDAFPIAAGHCLIIPKVSTPALESLAVPRRRWPTLLAIGDDCAAG